MLADDAFRAQLRQIVGQLRSWAAAQAGAARIQESEGETFWRLHAAPAADNACPFELILHHDRHFDLAAGPEVYERMPTEDLELIPPLVEAIAAGRVIRRTWVSRNTGAVRSVETIITLEDGRTWRRERLNEPLARAIGAEDCEAHDHQYAPYRLG
ncbi:MAG: hypothetical protein ACM31O_16435 [Bacteroidota bacterium]|jgi:hypothetical protein